jgi:hypothetical protein
MEIFSCFLQEIKKNWLLEDVATYNELVLIMSDPSWNKRHSGQSSLANQGLYFRTALQQRHEEIKTLACEVVGSPVQIYNWKEETWTYSSAGANPMSGAGVSCFPDGSSNCVFSEAMINYIQANVNWK